MKVVSLVLYRWVVNTNMANNLALGVIEIQNEHSGDESDDDVDDVVEYSPCGRWEKRRQEVRKFLMFIKFVSPFFAMRIFLAITILSFL